jgi:hypothetical protein
VVFLIERNCGMRVFTLVLAGAFAACAAAPANAAPVSAAAFRIAQLAAPPLATADAAEPSAAEQRMRRRYPQPVRVGDLVGLPVLDDDRRTLGYVRAVVRTPQNRIELIVDYDGWFGWDARPVAVPIEVIGIQGRELASLDMPRAEYAAAPVWRQTDETALADADSVSVALSRR